MSAVILFKHSSSDQSCPRLTDPSLGKREGWLLPLVPTPSAGREECPTGLRLKDLGTVGEGGRWMQGLGRGFLGLSV